MKLMMSHGADISAKNKHRQTPLHTVANGSKDCPELCEILLKHHAEINAVDKDGNQPLHFACKQTHTKIVKLMMSHGADISAENKHRQTPLHTAVNGSNDCPELCEILLKHHAEINAVDINGNQPLHFACRQTHTKIVKLMMSHAADTSAENNHRQTPLHKAAGGLNDCPELCEILLKHHAEMNAVDINGNQPLHLACKQGHTKTMNLLLSHSADVRAINDSGHSPLLLISKHITKSQRGVDSEGNHALHITSKSGILMAVQLLVDLGADTNSVNKHGQTPLHAAAGGEKDCPEVCEILLKHGANINAVDVDESQLLHLACKRGHEETMKLLLSYGADTNAVNKCGQTPLHTAASRENDCPELCEILLKHDTKIDAVDVYGSQPLHLACRQGHAETVKLLLSYGADTNAVNKCGQTPLHTAAIGEGDCPEVCEILLTHDAKIDAVDVDGSQPLHLACKQGHTKAVNLLLSHSADVRAINDNGHSPLLLISKHITGSQRGVNSAGNHALHIASKSGMLMAVQVLVDLGADTDAVNKHGQTPLHTAANRESDCPELCEILLKHDAKINAVDVNGSQPLHLACKQGHAETGKLLLSYGADTNAVNKHGQTPLHTTANRESGCPELCETLLKHDAKIDAVDADGSQPLHLACKQCRAETGKLLLSYGADTNAVNKCGQTPLHTAASRVSDCPELCEILLKHDAKINAVDEDGNQPLHLACKQRHTKTVNLLLSHSADARAINRNGHSPLLLISKRITGSKRGVGREGNNALHITSKNGMLMAVQVLVDLGANTNAVNKHGQTPLHAAAGGKKDCPEVCEILLKHGAKMDAVDEDGNQPLQWACKWGHVETGNLLLSCGADTNAVNKCGQTPLHTAASGESDCPELCVILLKRDARINAVDEHGNQPLHLACKQWHTKTVNLLLSHSADVRAIDGNGHSPVLLCSKRITLSQRGVDSEGNHDLHMTSENGMSTAVVDLGADTNTMNKHGQTPLHAAAGGKKDCPEVCEILLKHNSKINAVDDDANHPLHLACTQGHVEAGKLLVSHGADLEAVNKARESVLHMVAMSPNDCLDLCHYLVKGGANPNIHSNDGKLPCEVALQSGNLQTFQFLFTNSAIYKSADLRDVDRTYTCSNMLLVAIQMGNVDICRQLLENGASANTTLDDGTHCLELTLTGKKEKILCLLLLHGADIFGALSRMSVKSRATAESKSQKALVQAACRIQ